MLSRPAEPPDLTFTYGPHPDHLVDVYLPPAGVDGPRSVAAPAPVLVMLHGGFWRQAYDRTHVRPMACALRQAGWVVAAPEYRRVGGDGGWPQTAEDVRDALAALPRSLPDLAPDRVDLNRVVLAGHSAGGHLAMWWARSEADASPLDVRRVVGLAPVADLAAAHQARLGDDAVLAFLGGSPQEQPEVYAAASPAALPPGTVSTVVVHGTQDDVVPVAMSRALSNVRLVELPDADHFAVIDPLSAAWPHVLDALLGSRG